MPRADDVVSSVVSEAKQLRQNNAANLLRRHQYPECPIPKFGA